MDNHTVPTGREGEQWNPYSLTNFVFGVVPLLCVKKSFITKQMQRGEGGWGGGGGGGGAEDWFTEGQNPNYDSARFTKACNINEIQRFAKIPETARD